jgi:hypothetical protein
MPEVQYVRGDDGVFVRNISAVGFGVGRKPKPPLPVPWQSFTGKPQHCKKRPRNGLPRVGRSGHGCGARSATTPTPVQNPA